VIFVIGFIRQCLIIVAVKLQSALSKLEDGLQSLVEGSAAKLSPPGGDSPTHPPQETLPEAETPEAAGETSSLPFTPDENGATPGAFLIVSGEKMFPLDGVVVNIGRLPDNQLVLDDPRVSRNHAQLRAVRGRYIIFDLESTGGTFVNGQRVTQCPLHPGDVISLAGVSLIFGQDTPPIASTQRISSEPS
jgi:hypothetical protein